MFVVVHIFFAAQEFLHEVGVLFVADFQLILEGLYFGQQQSVWVGFFEHGLCFAGRCFEMFVFCCEVGYLFLEGSDLFVEVVVGK